MPRYAAATLGVLLLIVLTASSHTTMAQNTPSPVPPEWQTLAEKTDYRETPRYEETVAYSRKLASASPFIRYESFGRSGEGRPLPLLVAASGNTFTPAAARSAGKVV